MAYYNLVRCLIAVVLIAVVLLVNKKRHFIKKQSVLAIIVIACFGLSAVLHLLPFESAFISFDTPEKAANYYSNSDIDNIIYGDNSCLVLYSNGNTKRQILTKDDNGWKIHSGFEIKESHMTLVNRTSVYIISLENSTDRYIVISDFSEKKLTVSDNINSVFYSDSDGNYFAYLSNFSDDYTVNVNGETVTFGK